MDQPMLVLISSTLRQSRPYKAGLKKSVHVYVRTSVRPQKDFFSINEIWHLGRS